MGIFDSFEFIVLLVLVFFLITTFIIKKLVKTSKTFYVGSMIKTTRFNGVLKKFTFLGRFLDYMAYVGLILGFGLLGLDYLVGRKQKQLWKRLLILAVGFVVLFSIFDFFFKPLFAANPNTALFAPSFPYVFAIFGLAGFILYTLIVNAIDIILKLLSGKKACPGVAPIIPGVQIPNVPIVVPFIAWIPLFLILIIHEGFHGIQAYREKIKVKSTGLLLLGLFPIGAFVEPDERQLKHKSKLAQLRVFANGATSNLASIFVMLGIAMLLVPVLLPIQDDLIKTRASGVEAVFISDVTETTEFCGDVYPNSAFAQLEPGMQVLAIQGMAVKTIADIQIEIADARQSGDGSVIFSVETEEGELQEKILTPNALGRFGFSMEETLREGFVFPEDYNFNAALLNAIYTIINWFIILSLLVAIVNFLPMDPFDGGKMARIIYLPYLSFLNLPPQQTEKFFQKTMLYFVLLLFLLNAIPLFL